MFQPFAYHRVEAQQVVRGYALAIRRIGDDDRFPGGLLELLEGLLLQHHVLADAGGLYVAHGYLVCFRIVVVAVNLMSELTLLTVVVVEGVEQFLVEVHPLLESEFLAEYTRSDVAGDESRLDGYGARTAHGVYQVTFASPAGHQYHSCGQHFVERSFYSFLTVAPSVERFAAGIERKCATGFGDVDVEQHVGLVDAYAGTLARLLAEVVHDGILHLVGHELGMAELLAEDGGFYGKGFVRVQILFPTDGFYLFVDLVGVFGLEVLDGFQDSDGCAQAEVRFVHHLFVTAEGDHATAYLDVVGSQCGEFLRQHFFQSLKGFGNHFKRLFAHLFSLLF